MGVFVAPPLFIFNFFTEKKNIINIFFLLLLVYGLFVPVYFCGLKKNLNKKNQMYIFFKLKNESPKQFQNVKNKQ